MQKNKKINGIPAVLMHTIDGVLYRVNGTIVGINESALTCSMKFKGYKVLHNIPFNKVYLNEGILDNIKDYGKKAWNTIKSFITKIGGFLFPINEDGEADMSCINAPINVAIMSSNGEIPEMTFIPSSNMLSIADEQGIDISAGDYEYAIDSCAADEDIPCIEKYWSRVMNEYQANESFNIRQAVKYVNEKYYKPSKLYKSLNEGTIVTLKSGIEKYGENVTSTLLLELLRLNIMSQLSGTAEKHSDEKPLLIFGAPGIGKTAIVHQFIKLLAEEKRTFIDAAAKEAEKTHDSRSFFKKRIDDENVIPTGLDLNMMYIIGGSIYRDDFLLPTVEQNAIGEWVAKDTPKVWLPVYTKPSNKFELIKRDQYYNASHYLPGKENARYDGGIIFVDEFFRLNEKSSNIVMNLVNEHTINHLYLASKWGWVLASNRAFDLLESEKTLVLESAKETRYAPVNYTPTIEEWIAWAKRPNMRTGRLNVDNIIVEFIESVGKINKAVWTDALDFGSHDVDLTDKEKSLLGQLRDNTISADDALSIVDSLGKSSHKSLLHLSWNPRIWDARINQGLFNVLQYRIFLENIDPNLDKFANTIMEPCLVSVSDDYTENTNVKVEFDSNLNGWIPEYADNLENSAWEEFIEICTKWGVFTDNNNLQNAGISELTNKSPRIDYIKVFKAMYDDVISHYNENSLYNQIFTGEWGYRNIDYLKLADALDKVPNKRWYSWYNVASQSFNLAKNAKGKIQNDDDSDDDSMETGRIAAVFSYLLESIAMAMGKKSVPYAEWKVYFNFGRIFKPLNCLSIWQTGKMISRYEKTDEETDFNRNDDCKWKNSPGNSIRGIGMILKEYPSGEGALTTMVKADLEKFKKITEKGAEFDATAAKPKYQLSNTEYNKLFKKYTEMYSVKINGKKINLLFEDDDLIPDTTDVELRELREMQMNVLATLENCEFAREYSNVAKYIVKVDLQANRLVVIGVYNETMTLTWIKEHLPFYYNNIPIKDFIEKEGTINNGEGEITAVYRPTNDLRASYCMMHFAALIILNKGMNYAREESLKKFQ